MNMVEVPADQWERITLVARYAYSQRAGYPASVSILLAHAADALTDDDLAAIGAVEP